MGRVTLPERRHMVKNCGEGSVWEGLQSARKKTPESEGGCKHAAGNPRHLWEGDRALPQLVNACSPRMSCAKTPA